MPTINIFLSQLCHVAIPSCGSSAIGLFHLMALYCIMVCSWILCPTCLLHLEDTDHIFVNCYFLAKIWVLAYQHEWIAHNPFLNAISFIITVLHDLLVIRSSDLPKIVVLLWSIWKNHNAIIFAII